MVTLMHRHHRTTLHATFPTHRIEVWQERVHHLHLHRLLVAALGELMTVIEIVTCIGVVATVVQAFRTPTITVNNHLNNEPSDKRKLRT
jgi:hypothetical protein